MEHNKQQQRTTHTHETKKTQTPHTLDQTKDATTLHAQIRIFFKQKTDNIIKHTINKHKVTQ